MNSNINLKELWQKQLSIPVPLQEEIFAKAKRLKNKTRNKLVLSIVLLLGTTIFILFVWFTSNLHLLSTKIGTTLTVLAIFLSIINSSNILFSLQSDHLLVDNHNYLNQMLRLKKKQEFTGKKIMSIYYVLLSTGLGLYMFEPASKMTITGVLLAYICTFIWISIAWFYLRPRAIKKQQAKMNEVIQKLQDLQHAESKDQ